MVDEESYPGGECGGRGNSEQGSDGVAEMRCGRESRVDVVAYDDDAAARAAGAFLITVPSRPGKQIGGDYTTNSLDDPALIKWAEIVKSLDE